MVRSVKRKSDIGAKIEASRGRVANGSPPKKPKLNIVDGEENIFENLLSVQGFILDNNSITCTSDDDQIVLQKKLLITLKSHRGYPEVLNELIEGFESLIAENDRFIACLLPISRPRNDFIGSQSRNYDSLFKILLGIDLLQTRILNCLFEKLAVLSADDGSMKPHFQGQEIDLPHLIINQFRWLDRIVEEKELVSKLFEVISVSELPIQREVIACLPEVVSDSGHPEVCQQLKDILQQTTELTTAVIDAFSNLNLQGSLLTEVRQSVLDILESANLEDCPTAVKFILQSIEDDDCVEVIRELRSRLSFGNDGVFRQPEFSSTVKERNEESIDHEVLILDFIRLAIRFQKCIASGWLKVIESVNDSSSSKIVDLYALMVTHGISSKKKSVEAILRHKIKGNVFTKELVEEAFAYHSQAFADLFKEILSIAETLLRSPEIAVSNYGSTIYEKAFINFDTFCQQEVVAALITHIGSGLETDIESAFYVLNSLVVSHPEKIAPFTVFLKGILDYLDNLKISQIRHLFSMISSIIVEEATSETVFEDDMHILIRKYLSNSSIKYKRIGIIGSVMIAANMSKKGASNDDYENIDFSSSQAARVLQSGTLKELIKLLELARSCVSKDPEAAALFYDELSSVVATGELDPRIVHWIAETMATCFQDEFLVEAKTLKKTNNLELSYDLDEQEEDAIALNLFPLLLKSQVDDSQASSSSSSLVSRSSTIAYMNPLFRLLAICEGIQNQGNLEGIDALLGCPIVLFVRDAVEKLSTLSIGDKELICKALFYCINWLREIINAFSIQSDPETKGKILCRLETVAALGEILNKCLQDITSFIPPQAIFDCEEILLKPPQLLQHDKSRKKKGKRKGNQKESCEGLKDATEPTGTEKDIEVDRESVSDDKVESSNKPDSSFSWMKYRCFLREFDLKIFNVLHYGCVSKNVLDTDMNTKETEVISLKPSSVQLLLEDLESKAKYILPSSAAVRKSLLKRKADKDIGFSHLSQLPGTQAAEMIINLIPALCNHLETINSHFQAALNKTDCILDDMNADGLENEIMLNNFQMILSCFLRLISWERLKRHASKPLLKKILMYFASRIKGFDDAEAKIPALLRESVNYFSKLSLNSSDLSTAVLILKILEALQQLDEGEETKMAIAKMTEKYLKQEWSSEDCESGQKYNESLSHLIKLHIDASAKPLEVVEEYSNYLAEFSEERSRHESVPTLNKNTFPVFYKVIADSLTTVIKRDLSDKTHTVSDDDQMEVLDITSCCVRIFNSLISMVKAVETRSVLGSALKNGRLFLEVFLKYCMPILDLTLKKKKDEVHGILKNLQQSTRSLHHFCGHSKVAQDMTLTNYVPSTKKCLETFVFRVKAMLAVNQCHSAFWLGNLKNRDIQGNEIHSQASIMENDIEVEEIYSQQVTEVETAEDINEEDGEHDSYSESF